MDLVHRILDGETTAALRQDNRFSQVGSLAALLRVNTYHTECLPDLLLENVKPKLHGNRDAAVERLLRYRVDFLNGNDVDLVVDIQALDVLAVSLDHINKVVDIVVAAEGDVCIVDFVFVEHVLYHLAVDLGQGRRRIELDAASLLWVDSNVRLRLI